MNQLRWAKRIMDAATPEQLARLAAIEQLPTSPISPEAWAGFGLPQRAEHEGMSPAVAEGLGLPPRREGRRRGKG